MDNSVMLVINGRAEEAQIKSFSESGVVDLIAEQFDNGVDVDDLEITGIHGGQFLAIRVAGLHNSGNRITFNAPSQFDLVIIGSTLTWTGQWKARK